MRREMDEEKSLRAAVAWDGGVVKPHPPIDAALERGLACDDQSHFTCSKLPWRDGQRFEDENLLGTLEVLLDAARLAKTCEADGGSGVGVLGHIAIDMGGMD